MGGDSKTLDPNATPQAFPGSPVSRRSLLQAVPAIMMAPATPGIALASADSPRASSKETRRLQIDKKFVLFPINN